MHPLITTEQRYPELLNKMYTLSKKNNIILTWISSHMKWQTKLQEKKRRSNPDIHIQYKNLIHWSKTINIDDKWQKIMGQSNTQHPPLQSRYRWWVAGKLQKKRKWKDDTFQTLYWLHPHHSLPPLKREDSPICSVLPTVKHTLWNCLSLRENCPKKLSGKQPRGPF